MKNRELEYDVMRLIALIAVITTHVCDSVIHDVDVNTTLFIYLNIIRASLTWDVPIFVMVSGRFMINPDNNKSPKQIFGKYVKHLFIAFLCWSLVYVITDILIDYKNGSDVLSSWKNYIFSFLTGEYHMWYIFMLVCLYVSIPIFNKIAEDKKILEYYIVLTLIGQVIVQYGVRTPLFDTILSAMVGKSFYFLPLGYSCYFLLGYYLHRYSLPNNTETILMFMIPIGIIVSCVGTTLMSIKSDNLDEFFSTYQTPAIILESCGIYLFFIKKCSMNYLRPFYGFITQLGRWGLGIYFVHALVITIISKTNCYIIPVHPYIGIPFVTLLTFTGSYILIFIISKIPILKDIMM